MPGSWTKCADEGGTCSFDGRMRVRYGANNTYVYGTFTKSVVCSPAVFGDPLVGTVKACYYQTPPLTPPGPAPDYDKVDDFLNGKRFLLRNEDFAIAFTAGGGNDVRRN
ncbi:MAG: hypothetical protein WKF30_00520 [Pyrinomonadaceae bacterium]